MALLRASRGCSDEEVLCLAHGIVPPLPRPVRRAADRCLLPTPHDKRRPRGRGPGSTQRKSVGFLPSYKLKILVLCFHSAGLSNRVTNPLADLTWHTRHNATRRLFA